MPGDLIRRTSCPTGMFWVKEKELLQKVWYDDISPKKVFHTAIKAFKEDHERIISDYLAN